MTAQLSKKGEAWSARFSEPVSDLVKRYTASVFFDKRLAEVDMQGSLAHAEMLARQNIISAEDYAAIQRGLAQIHDEIAGGKFEWLLDLEDVHLNIEKRLTELVGDAGKRLHTGRSRNDQVATDIRLYLRGVIDDIDGLLRDLRLALVDLAEQHADTIMPGFTHMQVAQPITFGHHILAYVEMFGRDAERMRDCRKRVNRLPLGAAALQGYATATDLADYLVKKGLPFRDAHEAVAHAVRACVDQGCDLSEMTLEQLRGFSNLIEDDIFGVLTLEGSVAARDHIGGTAPRQVRLAIEAVRRELA